MPSWLGTGAAIALGIAGLVARHYRLVYLSRRAAIASANASDIPKIVGDEVDKLKIDVAGLTKEQRFAAVMEVLSQRADRTRRLFLLSTIVAVSIAVVVVLSIFLERPPIPVPPAIASTTPAPAVSVLPRERVEGLSIKTIQDRLGTMILDFGRSDPAALPNFLEKQSGTWPQMLNAAFSVETGGMAEGLGRFAVVVRSGTFTVERLYMKVLATADCPLRDETTGPTAPTVQWWYRFWISKEYDTYDLVPLDKLGESGVWQYRAKDGKADADEFGIRLRAAPYTLYLVSLVAEGRNDDTRQRIASASPILPLLFMRGAFDGCSSLERWLSKDSLKTPSSRKEWRREFQNTLAYQMAIADIDKSPALFSGFLSLQKPVVQTAVDELRQVLGSHKENYFLQRNVEQYLMALNAKPCRPNDVVPESWDGDLKDQEVRDLCMNTSSGKLQNVPWEATKAGTNKSVKCSCDPRR